MATALTRDGDTWRVGLSVPLAARLIVLPLVGGAGYLFYLLFLVVEDVAAGHMTQREALIGEIVLLLLGVAVGLPGLAALLVRAYVTIDKDRGQLTSTRQFGPLKFARATDLSQIKKVTITAEQPGEGSWLYSVNLTGRRSVKPILAATFDTLKAALPLAHELAASLRIPVEDHSNTEPDED